MAVGLKGYDAAQKNAFSQLQYMQLNINRLAEHFVALDDYGIDDAKCAISAKQVRVLAEYTAMALLSFRRQLELSSLEH